MKNEPGLAAQVISVNGSLAVNIALRDLCGACFHQFGGPVNLAAPVDGLCPLQPLTTTRERCPYFTRLPKAKKRGPGRPRERSIKYSIKKGRVTYDWS